MENDGNLKIQSVAKRQHGGPGCSVSLHQHDKTKWKSEINHDAMI